MSRHPADRSAADPKFWLEFKRCYDIAAGRVCFSRAEDYPALGEIERREAESESVARAAIAKARA